MNFSSTRIIFDRYYLPIWSMIQPSWGGLYGQLQWQYDSDFLTIVGNTLQITTYPAEFDRMSPWIRNGFWQYTWYCIQKMVLYFVTEPFFPWVCQTIYELFMLLSWKLKFDTWSCCAKYQNNMGNLLALPDVVIHKASNIDVSVR